MAAEEVTIKTIVQLVHIDETGDSYYRMRWPLRDLAAQDPTLRIINLQHNAAERYSLIEQADLAVIYQSHDIDLLPIIRRRHQAGKKTIVEYNDNFYAPATPSPVQEGWSSPLLWASYEMMIQAADDVQVTGPGLLELFSARFGNKRIEVLENHLPFRPEPVDVLWKDRSAALDQGRIVIGWAGSVGHMADLIALSPMLRSLVARYPNVYIAMMGNESIPEVLGLPSGRFSFVPWGTMEQYFLFLRTLHIGIAAALDTPYNRCRSDIKAVEFSAQAVAPILSQVLPYEEFQKATGCLSFSGVAALNSELEQLIQHPQEIKRRAAEAHSYVTEKRIGVDHRRRLELYSELLPAEPAKVSFSIPAGYHEVAGTPETEYRSQKALNTIARLLHEKQFGPAAAVAKQAMEQNPYSAEVTLQYLKILRVQNQALAAQSQIVQAIQHAANNFPHDLRFSLLHASAAPTPADQVAVWEKIVEHIKGWPAAARFFQRDVLKNLLPALNRNPLLIEVAQQVAVIFPMVITLRLELGIIFEQSGHDQPALEQFKPALTLLDVVSGNVEQPAADRKYILTWCEALESRLKG